MTRVIEKLERLGLVLRVHGQFRNARVTAVAITEAGQKNVNLMG
jgi:DNA-binding MarR family transcriptional regulator